MSRRAIVYVIGSVAVAALAAGAAGAQSGAQNAASGTQNTPVNFDYVIKDGKRVPKPNTRIVNADGSWREETRQGNCVEIKEGLKDGSVKTTRKCD
jgi:hypothetical protein